MSTPVASIVLTVAPTISGPMPSPGISVIVCFAIRSYLILFIDKAFTQYHNKLAKILHNAQFMTGDFFGIQIDTFEENFRLEVVYLPKKNCCKGVRSSLISLQIIIS